MQMVFLPQFVDQVIPLVKLGKSLGVDYIVIKHCSDDESGSLGVKYENYKIQNVIETLKEAERHSGKDYQVSVKWSKILAGRERLYSACYGPPLFLQMSGSGLVAPCGSFFNDKYKKYHIGNITETRLIDIWKSERYWEVMNMIRDESFDARTQCACLCLQHKCNEYLDSIVKGQSKVIIANEKYGKPSGVNFI
jgi:sulfatase maturation enzyme AslB (radical SAM superfamily)